MIKFKHFNDSAVSKRYMALWKKENPLETEVKDSLGWYWTRVLDGDKVIGFTNGVMTPDYSMLALVYVFPQYRKQGYLDKILHEYAPSAVLLGYYDRDSEEAKRYFTKYRNANLTEHFNIYYDNGYDTPKLGAEIMARKTMKLPSSLMRKVRVEDLAPYEGTVITKETLRSLYV
jgi:hypothetical protein